MAKRSALAAGLNHELMSPHRIPPRLRFRIRRRKEQVVRIFRHHAAVLVLDPVAHTISIPSRTQSCACAVRHHSDPYRQTQDGTDRPLNLQGRLTSHVHRRAPCRQA